MVRAAIIESGVVTNVAGAPDVAFAQAKGWVPSETAEIGDLYDGTDFTKPPPVIVVPQSVTRRQARLALLAFGLLDDVEAAIDALPEPDRSVARIEWDEANSIDRDNALINQLAPGLGLDDAGVDQLFIVGKDI